MTGVVSPYFFHYYELLCNELLEASRFLHVPEDFLRRHLEAVLLGPSINLKGNLIEQLKSMNHIYIQQHGATLKTISSETYKL